MIWQCKNIDNPRVPSEGRGGGGFPWDTWNASPDLVLLNVQQTMTLYRLPSVKQRSRSISYHPGP